MADPLSYELDHIHVYCADVAATEKWFVDGMGAELVRHRTAGDLPATDLRLAGADIFLFTAPQGASLPEAEHRGTEHFGLRVQDLAATAAELKRRGVDFEVEPKQTRPDLRIAFVKGPDGIRIELLQRG